MKKILCLFVIGLLVFSGLGAFGGTVGEDGKTISEKIFFSQPAINEMQDFISVELVDATAYLGESGKPALPVVTKVYTFPLGTTINSVEVSFSNQIEMKITKPIKPAPEFYPLSINAINTIYVEPEISYSDIELYPIDKWSYTTGAGLDNGNRVVFLTIPLQPIQYKPNENLILYSDSATVEIKYTLPERPVIFGDSYDLLILSPSQFESALQRLVDHKNSLDPPVRTILKTLDDVPSGVGVDVQEDIKYFIKDAIESWGITYVLLVGAGVEGAELFPVRQAWTPSTPNEDYFPSDLYFADIYDAEMNFSSWDANGNGKFAEYPADMSAIDVHPDVYLGKLPCNNVKEVNIVVDKILQYKAHNKMTNRILQAGGDSFTSDNINEGEYANEKVMEKLPGYSTTQLWASNGKLTKANIARGFRSNVDFVDFCGHGSWATFATHPTKDEDNWIPPKTLRSPYTGFLFVDFDLFFVLNPKKYPVCVYKSCSNSKYSASETCFSWKTVSKNNGGGIATFASSGISYGATGVDIVARTTGWMEVKSFEELVSTKILGQVWANSISDYYNTFAADLKFTDWKTLLAWSMFGDPTLVIQDGDDPESIPLGRNTYFSFFQRILNNPFLSKLIEKI
jgi:hypothetical protein